MDTSRPRLLLLEDEEYVSLVYTRALEGEGYSVTCLTDGEAGLEAATSGSYDLCLLNVLLPGMDGYSIAQQLHERKIKLPLIFLTATPRPEVEAKATTFGFRVAYVPKPSPSKELFLKIKEVLDGKGWL